MSKEQTPITDVNELIGRIVRIAQDNINLFKSCDEIKKAITENGFELISKKESNAKVLEALESTSMKEAYNAGQKSMYCGCYDTKDCTSFEEWVLNKQK